MSGKFYGVGVGPGDPELMTLKAVRVLRKADVIVVPELEKESCRAYRIAVSAMPELKEKEILCRNFPMTRDGEVLELAVEAVCEELQELIRAGWTVAFLADEDPTLYSACCEVYRMLKAAGADAELVSGVPAFCAAAGRLGISLARRNETLRVIPAGASDNGAGTRVYIENGNDPAALKDRLLADAPLEIWAVADCGMESERLMSGPDEAEARQGERTTVIVKRPQ